ncbi:hypothetical protein PINS_up001882 [Pythium insidiosum]|nr:hypothetical protein PINS_up001882 [Pythium insidiosum]
MADARVASAPLAHCGSAVDAVKSAAMERPPVENGHAGETVDGHDVSGSAEGTSEDNGDEHERCGTEQRAAVSETAKTNGSVETEDSAIEIVTIDEDDDDENDDENSNGHDHDDDDDDNGCENGGGSVTSAAAKAAVESDDAAQDAQQQQQSATAEPAEPAAATSEESGSRRRRKRSRRLGFSSSRARGSVGRQRRVLSQREDGAADEDVVVLSGDTDGGLYPPPPPGEPVVAWQWSTCDEYFAPITQRHLDDLVALRRDAANVVAANAEGVVERPWLASLLRDATDVTSGRIQRTLRRGRWYRDVWAEEDAVAGERRGSRSSKKRPLAGCEVVPCLRALVRGYDDDRFEDYVARLEQHVASASPTDAPWPLPSPPPADNWHPAAWGAWRLAEDAAASVHPAVVHPASLARSQAPQRWKEEQENEKAPAESSSVFGSAAMEDDEIARELALTVTRLVALSALNWRTAQTLYERAVTGIACAPVLAAEAAAERRLEALYRELFPPRSGDGEDDEDDDRDDRDTGRHTVVGSRTADVVAFGARCGSGSTVVDPTHAAAVSVEFALRLQRGDEVDVLDRHGCWSDGVVLELLEEGSGSGPTTSVKFVRVAVEHSGVEWIAVTEARLLPRGVADGRASFLVGPSRVRRDRVEISRAEADALAQSWATRHARHEAALDPRHASLEAADPRQDERKASKRQRKR